MESLPNNFIDKFLQNSKEFFIFHDEFFGKQFC